MRVLLRSFARRILLARLRAGLAFYADPACWHDSPCRDSLADGDRGARARRALWGSTLLGDAEVFRLCTALSFYAQREHYFNGPENDRFSVVDGDMGNEARRVLRIEPT